MQLFLSKPSPYARKVHILLHLTGLIDETELVQTNPLESEDLRKVNPLGKIPALIDGDRTLVDSPLICEYIDHTFSERGGSSFLRRNTPEYFDVQSVHAACDGILDAAVATVQELRREESLRSDYWFDRWRKAIELSVSNLEVSTLGDKNNVHIGTIATATALAYLDFRLPHIEWRPLNQALAGWLQELETESWYTNTKPE